MRSRRSRSSATTTAERPIPFSHDGKHLDLDLNPAWPVHRDATIRIEYKVRDPRAGLYFFAPSAAEPDVPTVLWSQGETIG